jgi:hypothetical protein
VLLARVGVGGQAPTDEVGPDAQLGGAPDG